MVLVYLFNFIALCFNLLAFILRDFIVLEINQRISNRRKQLLIITIDGVRSLPPRMECSVVHTAHAALWP